MTATLILSSNNLSNQLVLDLSQFLDLTPDSDLDPQNPSFSSKVISHSLLKEGGVLALEDFQAKELVFPVKLNAATNVALQQLVQQINQVVTSRGATYSWQPPGASQPTIFDAISGELDVKYKYREDEKQWCTGDLKLFTQPFGRAAGPRPYAAASGVGPLLMITPYASGGALAIGASTQAGVSGFGGQQQGASSGVFYSGTPSLAGDAPGLLQISYVGPLPTGASMAGVVPYAAVSLLPDKYYQPLITTAQMTLSVGLRAAGSGASGVDDATIGTVGWSPNTTTLAAAVAVPGDGLLALAGGGAATTEYLKVTAFGLAVPSGATITGITVNVLRGSGGPATDASVRLVKAGTIQTTDKADTVNAWAPGFTTKSYGGPNDLWGGTWTPTDINNAGFGVAFAAQMTGSADLDYIQIVVSYQAAISPTADARAVASQYFLNSGIANYSFSPFHSASPGIEPATLWGGQHRLFAIARASVQPGTISTQQSSLISQTTTATISPGDWTVHDLGVIGLRASQFSSQVARLQVVPGGAGTVDLTALVMLPDSTTWFMNPTMIIGSQYGFPSPTAQISYSAFAPYTNSLVIDDVLGDQFIYSGASQTFAPSPTGVIPSSSPITSYSRGLAPRPDPNNGVPIVAILGVGQSFVSAQAVNGFTVPGASWANPQNQRTMAQVNVLERARYVMP